MFFDHIFKGRVINWERPDLLLWNGFFPTSLPFYHLWDQCSLPKLSPRLEAWPRQWQEDGASTSWADPGPGVRSCSTGEVGRVSRQRGSVAARRGSGRQLAPESPRPSEGWAGGPLATCSHQCKRRAGFSDAKVGTSVRWGRIWRLELRA